MLIMERCIDRGRVFRINNIRYRLVCISVIWSPAQQDHSVPFSVKGRVFKTVGIQSERQALCCVN